MNSALVRIGWTLFKESITAKQGRAGSGIAQHPNLSSLLAYLGLHCAELLLQLLDAVRLVLVVHAKCCHLLCERRQHACESLEQAGSLMCDIQASKPAKCTPILCMHAGNLHIGTNGKMLCLFFPSYLDITFMRTAYVFVRATLCVCGFIHQ